VVSQRPIDLKLYEQEKIAYLDQSGADAYETP
jgi:hypothetical protein